MVAPGNNSRSSAELPLELEPPDSEASSIDSPAIRLASPVGVISPSISPSTIIDAKAAPNAAKGLSSISFAILTIIWRSEEHTSELQSRPHLVCRLLLEKKKNFQTYLDITATCSP